MKRGVARETSPLDADGAPDDDDDDDDNDDDDDDDDTWCAVEEADRAGGAPEDMTETKHKPCRVR